HSDVPLFGPVMSSTWKALTLSPTFRPDWTASPARLVPIMTMETTTAEMPANFSRMQLLLRKDPTETPYLSVEIQPILSSCSPPEACPRGFWGMMSRGQWEDVAVRLSFEMIRRPPAGPEADPSPARPGPP